MVGKNTCRPQGENEGAGEAHYRRQVTKRMDSILSVAKSILNAVKNVAKGRSGGRRGKRSSVRDPAICENRARVVAALRDLHDRRGLSWMKAVRTLRGNPTWTRRMMGVSDASWRVYAHRKQRAEG